MIELTEETIVSIETTTKGERVAHFLGYGYPAYDPVCSFRFLRYNGFYGGLGEVIGEGFENYEECHGGDVSQSVAEFASYEEMVDVYLSIDNGKLPVLIREDKIDESTPDGVYLLC